jgi:acetyl-CoA synthetase
VVVHLIPPQVKAMVEAARADPEGFWARAASGLPWLRPWTQAYRREGASFRWFEGGLTNLSRNAVDRHVEAGRAGQAALVYASERGDRRVLTYGQLLHWVRRLSAALRGLGVRKGDRVTLYMPTCPEAIALMLACTRIGAVHSVVFAGFGAGALADRIRASGSKLVFTTDVTYRKGAQVPLKGIVDEALRQVPGGVEAVVVLERTPGGAALEPGRDLRWDQFLARAEGHSAEFEPMEANEPAYILATSGTTARPKLAVHTHGGYQVGIHSVGRWCFGLKPEDVWWSTSDIGWVVGHSYIVYAPLLAGCTTVAYEGALDYPGPETPWRLVEELRVTGIFTSPTAVRLLMKYGEDPALRYDRSSLERVVCAGEVLNPPAWEWLQKRVLQDRVPVIDHWWQTETGGPVIGNPYGVAQLPIKPGSAGLPLPGMEVAVLTPEGQECGPGERGILVLRRPLPQPDPDPLGGAGAVRPGLLAAHPRARRVLHGGRGPGGRGRVRVVRGTRRRGDQDRRPPHRHHRSGDRVPQAPRGGGSRGGGQARRGPGRGDLRLRGPQAGARALPRSPAGASGHRPEGAGPRGGGGRGELCLPVAQDP